MNIVKMDKKGGADPYVKFILGGLEIKTKKRTDTLNPKFYQILKIPTIFPTITQNLKMIFKDHDSFTVSSNEIIGSEYFKLFEID